MKLASAATLAALGLFLAAGCGDDGPTGEQVLLRQVVDGDTIEVAIGGGGPERVRLIGINTPERGECLSKHATTRLAALLSERPLTLGRDVSDRDSNGRLLRYVRAGQIFVNERMVRDGLAIAHRYPPDTAQSALLESAQADAKAQGRGMWDADACGRSADVRSLFPSSRPMPLATTASI